MDRLLVMVVILAAAALLWLAWLGVRVWLRRSIRTHAPVPGDDRPALIYFSSPDCAPCRLQQTPIVTRLEQFFGDRVRFEEYDATAHPELARQYRVLTVPTTAIVAPDGRVVAVNYGVTPADRLRRQLEEAMTQPLVTHALP